MKLRKEVIVAVATLVLSVVLIGAVGAEVASPLATQQGTITNLHMSDSYKGPEKTLFPTDTETVYVVFDYSDMHGEEWRIRVEDGGTPLYDATHSYSGSDTECITVTHTSGSIPPGNYGTMMYKGQYPSKTKLWHVRADTPGQITNLYMSDSPDGQPMTEFPPGTQTVYAVFDYADMPEDTEIGICVREVTELETGCVVEGSKTVSGSGGDHLRVSLPQLGEAFPAALYRSLVSKGGYVDQLTDWRVKHGIYLPLVCKSQP